MPEKRHTNKTEKKTNVSFTPEDMLAEKQWSGLEEGKYSPGVDPSWKAGSACFSVFYKDLVNEPDPGVRRGLYKVARSQVRKQGGMARNREGSHVYSSNRDQFRCS